MPLRKRTLRRMTPEVRKLAKILADLESVRVRLRNFLTDLQELELLAMAERNREKALQTDEQGDV